MKSVNNNKKTTESGLRVELIRNLDNINKLTKDWDDLYKRADNASPYYSRPWVHTYISENNIKGTPLLVTVWSNSKLVVLLPLAISSYFGIKVATIAPNSMLCETGILVDTDYREAVQVLAEFWVREKIADVFYNKFTNSRDIHTNELFDELNRQGYLRKNWHRHTSLLTNLESDFDMVLRKGRTREQRKKLRYHERRIFKLGDIKLTRYIGKQITPEITRRIADIQENSWVKQEGAAVLCQPFYQKLLLELAEMNIGCIWLMTNSDDDVAFLYALMANNSLFPKWMAYRLKYGSSSLSFGKVMCMGMIRDACNEGLDVIDFGFGEDKWKTLWATNKKQIDTIITGGGVIGCSMVLLCCALRILTRFRWYLYTRYQKLKKSRK